MADRDYKAFIVEGEAREPLIIDNISKVFFSHGNFKIITLPASENIYMLWKKLKADDFDTDIIEVLRESNDDIGKQLDGLSRDDFSEVFLFFDYDMHQTNLAIIDVFSMKVSCLFDHTDTFEYERYTEIVNPSAIYLLEEKKTKAEGVFVLSAFPEFLVEYYGGKLWRTCVRHRSNKRENC